MAVFSPRTVAATLPGDRVRATNPSISVVLPCMNEERNLPYVFSRFPEGIDEVILVDGGSVDRTIARALELWPTTRVVHQTRRGKGNALACGFAASTGDIVVMIDADGSTDPAEIPQFVQACIAGADIAKGSRFRPGGGSHDITAIRKLGNAALSGLVNVLFRTKYSDLCYGYNAFWRDIVPIMDLPDVNLAAPKEGMLWGDGFEVETLVNIRVAAAGLGITEVPSLESARIHGVSNLNAFRDGRRVLRTILSEYRRARRATGTRFGIRIKAHRPLTERPGLPAWEPALQAAPPAVAEPSLSSLSVPSGYDGGDPADLVNVLVNEPAEEVLVGASVAAGVSEGGDHRLHEQVSGDSGSPAVDPRVSVVIPCYSLERWPYIVEAVNGALEQSPRPAAVVLAVDNNPVLFDRAKRELREVTVVENTFAQGAAGARNTGIMQTTTPLVVLLDDDARPRPGWLAGLIEPFADPQVVGTGGAVVGNWHGGQPAWFPHELFWIVGLSPRSTVTEVTTTRNVWALSMGVRRDVFESVGGFQEDFTKVGRRSMPDDTDLCLRMSQASGGSWAFVPGAIVDHRVPADRAKLKYVLVRSYEEGRGKIAIARRRGGYGDLGQERSFVTSVVPRAILRGLADFLRGRGVASLARSGVLVGSIVAAGVGALAELASARGRAAGRDAARAASRDNG